MANVNAQPGEWPGVTTAQSANNDKFNGTSLPTLKGVHTSKVAELRPPNGNLSWDYRSMTDRSSCTAPPIWSCPESYWHVAATNRHAHRTQTPRGRSVARNLESTLYKRHVPGGSGDTFTHDFDAKRSEELKKNGPVRIGLSFAHAERVRPDIEKPDAAEQAQDLARQIERGNHPEIGALAALAGYY